MPTVFRRGPYRFFFYAGDRGEPNHVHVEREDKVAKIWLDPVRLSSSGGFNRQELSQILGMIRENHDFIMESWNEYFGN